MNFGCWRSSPEIVNWMTEHRMGQNDSDYLQLWDMFQKKAYTKLVEANSNKEIPVVLWTSHLTAQGSVDKYLDKDKYIIQIWANSNDQVIAELVNKGFRVIFSNYDALYFDCGWVNERNSQVSYTIALFEARRKLFLAANDTPPPLSHHHIWSSCDQYYYYAPISFLVFKWLLSNTFCLHSPTTIATKKFFKKHFLILSPYHLGSTTQDTRCIYIHSTV